MRDPLSPHVRPRRRDRTRTSPRMTLLNQPPAPAAREPRVPIETGRPAGGLGPYEAAYDVAHGYSIERSIVVPRG